MRPAAAVPAPDDAGQRQSTQPCRSCRTRTGTRRRTHPRRCARSRRRSRRGGQVIDLSNRYDGGVAAPGTGAYRDLETPGAGRIKVHRGGASQRVGGYGQRLRAVSESTAGTAGGKSENNSGARDRKIVPIPEPPPLPGPRFSF